MIAMLFALMLTGDMFSYEPPSLEEVEKAFSTNVIYAIDFDSASPLLFYDKFFQYMHEVEDIPCRTEYENIIIESLAHMDHFVVLNADDDVFKRRLVAERIFGMYRHGLYQLKSLCTNKDVYFRLLDVAESLELQTCKDKVQEKELDKYNRCIASMKLSIVKICRKNALIYLRRKISQDEWALFDEKFDKRARRLERSMHGFLLNESNDYDCAIH